MRRPAKRPKPRPGTKRIRPRVMQGLMRVGVGPTIVYLAAGTNNAYKFTREDVEILETDTHKLVEELTEAEVKEAVERLKIKSLTLTDDEESIVQLASKYVLAGYFILKE
jgi:hypothetical protein